jgi:hypothetical protein
MFRAVEPAPGTDMIQHRKPRPDCPVIPIYTKRFREGVRYKIQTKDGFTYDTEFLGTYPVDSERRGKQLHKSEDANVYIFEMSDGSWLDLFRNEIAKAWII